MSQEAPSSEVVRSLQRGLAVIRSFRPGRGAMTVSEVANHTDLNRATVRRILRTLEELGYARSEDGRYVLLPSILQLGYAYLASQQPWDAAMPVMEMLSARVDENCLAGVLHGSEVICVARTSRRLVTVALQVGGRIPAYASSMGRVLLAHRTAEQIDEYFARSRRRALTTRTVVDEAALREEFVRVRERGWSIVSSEVEDGVLGVAVPVFGREREVVASLNVSAHGNRLDRERAEHQVLPALQDAAAEVGLLFGAAP